MARIFMAAYTNYRRDPRVKREAETLIAEGHDVVFLAKRQPGEPNEESIAGVHVIKTYGLKNKPNSFKAYVADYLLYFFMLMLHLTLHPFRYALIHINNMPDFLVFAAWLPKLIGKPVIHDIHDLMPELYMDKFGADERHWAIRLLLFFERWAGRFATRVLTVEVGFVDTLESRGIRRDKMTILLNLPDNRIFAPRPPLPPKPADAAFVMVYHGTLARRLGLDIGIEAVHRLRGKIPNMEFRIIGGGEERENLIALRDELDLKDLVTFSDGYVPVEDIPAMIADADLGLIPLRKSSGTEFMLPTKLLEYVNVGIASIVPHNSTIDRYFDDTMVRFIEAEDPDALAEAILYLYEHPEEREQLHKTASDKFLAKYFWPEHKKVYVELVNSLLNP